jgi:hypothetical protein
MSYERFPQVRATICRQVCTLLAGCVLLLGATRGLYTSKPTHMK